MYVYIKLALHKSQSNFFFNKIIQIKNFIYEFLNNIFLILINLFQQNSGNIFIYFRQNKFTINCFQSHKKSIFTFEITCPSTV